MYNRRSIVKAKLLFFVAAVAIGLLAGYCQAADDEATIMKRVEYKKHLRGEAKLIGLNFAVQKHILKIFHEKASQFAKLFDTNHDEMTNGFKKALVGAYWMLDPQKKKEAKETQYLSNLDGLLAKALHNLRTDAPIIHEWILKAFPSFLAIEADLSALTEWLDLAHQPQQERQPFDHRLDKPMMPQEHPDTKQLFDPELVNKILRELDPILDQMSSSTHRAKWRKEVEEMFARISNDSTLKEHKQPELDQLNKQRVEYDSMYVRLAIVRATFLTVKVAYEEKQMLKENRKAVYKKKRVEEKKEAENQQEEAVAAVATIDHQQQMAKELVVAIKHMQNYAEDLDIVRAQLETALRNTWEWDDKIRITVSELNVNVESYDKLGFNGDDGYHFEELAHGDMELFAQMLGKKKPYVPAVDGPEVVLKYQLMLNAAPLWQLRCDVRDYVYKQTSREEGKEKQSQSETKQEEHQKTLDNQCRCTFPGGELAWQNHHADLRRRN